MSYNPQPKQRPKRLPRRYPLKTIPSGIGDEGIVGNWLFYYLKGGDHLHDFSPKDNHGTIYNAKWVSTKRGWALDFDGVDDYVVVSGSTSLDNAFSGNEVTVMYWLNIDEQTSDYIDQFHVDGTSTRIEFRGVGENGFGWVVETDVGSNYIVVLDVWSANEWVFVACTYEGDTGKLYVDGNLEGSFTQTGTLLGGGDGVHVMADDDLNEFTDGQMSEVRIYNRALSAEEISLLYSRANV